MNSQTKDISSNKNRVTSSSKSKSKSKVSSVGIAVVKSTFNNTIVTITNPNGDVVAFSSGGRTQKGARKATAFAGEEAARTAAHKALELGMLEVHVKIKGCGNARDSGTRGLASAGLKILTISELTGIPHNGCRRRKKKRV